MSIRHPSEGIAFEPLSVVGTAVGALLAVLAGAAAWRHIWNVRPKGN